MSASSDPASHLAELARNGWRGLLSAGAGPRSVHEEALQLAQRFGARPPPGDRSLLLAGVDEALCACSVLSGPAIALKFYPSASPLIAAVAAQLGPGPNLTHHGAALGLLSLRAALEACGVSPSLPRFAPGPWQEALVLDNQFSPSQRLLLALLALDAGRGSDARVLLEVLHAQPGQDGQFADLGSWVAWLAQAAAAAAPRAEVELGWTALLRLFPAWLARTQVEWRHLLIGARVALGKLLGVAGAEIGATLHQQVVALGAEAPSVS